MGSYFKANKRLPAMNLPDIPLLSMLKTRMAWLNQRQDVLTQNVTNADTPGYVAHDLKALDFSKELRQSSSLTQSASARSACRSQPTARFCPARLRPAVARNTTTRICRPPA